MYQHAKLADDERSFRDSRASKRDTGSCFAFIADERTFGYSKSMRSRLFQQRPVRMLSSSG
jgi:hypothetical protein